MSYLVLQVRLYLQQFYAMFLKRALYSWRNWKVMVAQFLVPLVFTIVALVVARTLPSQKNTPLLRFSLSHYGPTRVPVSLALKSGFLASALANTYASQLSDQLAQDIKITGNSHNNTQSYLLQLIVPYFLFLSFLLLTRLYKLCPGPGRKRGRQL